MQNELYTPINELIPEQVNYSKLDRQFSLNNDEFESMFNNTPEQYYFRLPFIGHQPVNKQIKYLSILLSSTLLLLVLLTALDSFKFGNNTIKTQALGNIAMHSQRLAKASFGAIRADTLSLQQFKSSYEQVNTGLKLLSKGGSLNTEFNPRVNITNVLDPLTGDAKTALLSAAKTWESSRVAAELVLKGEVTALVNNNQFNELDSLVIELQLALQKLTASKTALDNSNTADLTKINQLRTLIERIANNAKNIAINKQEGLDIHYLTDNIAKDKLLFQKISTELFTKSDTGHANLAVFKQTLLQVAMGFNRLQQAIDNAASNLISNTPDAITPYFFSKESERIKTDLEQVQVTLNEELKLHNLLFWAILATALIAIAIGSLMVLVSIIDREKTAKVNLKENQYRALLAEQAKEQAHIEKSRVNEINQKNQQSILRLMNELQEIGQGNLTVQATVSEDITGAIADSINLTVEDLRNLVERINITTEGVATATNKTRQTTTMLLELNQQQSQHIQKTGDRVLNMAHNITEVCNRADGSSTVAQKALSASYTGQQAVQASLQGMNGIRDQIQETAKRIKRLGESSQQISEIVALIGDITEQTNVLALNASIQAASAGEAGRGFTVVAEEVQRLAERSGEATKQISALVRTIQTDTQDAVSAMEKSTQGVVEGAKLADAAGIAITDISKVSQELANIMLEISHTTRGQANQAQIVSAAIKHILTLTERTTLGTQDTSQSTDELSTLARALKTSVARFKVTA